MAPSKIDIPPDLLERARALYENGTSLDVIGRLMGVSGQTVRNRAIEYGWSRSRPARPPVPDTQWPDAPPPMREPAEEDAAPGAIVARLGRLIAREMLRTETYDHSPEVAARTLVMLARSAAVLHAMHGHAARHTEPEEEAPERVDRDAIFKVIAEIVERFEQIYDEDGKAGLLDRLRFLPDLEGLAMLIIGDREGRAARAEAQASRRASSS